MHCFIVLLIFSVAVKFSHAIAGHEERFEALERKIESLERRNEQLENEVREINTQQKGKIYLLCCCEKTIFVSQNDKMFLIKHTNGASDAPDH